MKIITKTYGNIEIDSLEKYDCPTKQQQQKAEDLSAVAFICWPADTMFLPVYVDKQIENFYPTFKCVKIGGTSYKNSVFAIVQP
jgi:hypothetical protein